MYIDSQCKRAIKSNRFHKAIEVENRANTLRYTGTMPKGKYIQTVCKEKYIYEYLKCS